MVVFYYTSVAYLDIALEIINAMKHAVELHVVIEIAPESKGTNILNVGSLQGLPTLASPASVLEPQALATFAPYFDGLASVQFFLFSRTGELSLPKVSGNAARSPALSARLIRMSFILIRQKPGRLACFPSFTPGSGTG